MQWGKANEYMYSRRRPVCVSQQHYTRVLPLVFFFHFFFKDNKKREKENNVGSSKSLTFPWVSSITRRIGLSILAIFLYMLLRLKPCWLVLKTKVQRYPSALAGKCRHKCSLWSSLSISVVPTRSGTIISVSREMALLAYKARLTSSLIDSTCEFFGWNEKKSKTKQISQCELSIVETIKRLSVTSTSKTWLLCNFLCFQCCVVHVRSDVLN